MVLDDIDALDTLASHIEGAGFEVSWAERDSFSGFVRFHFRDAFGNRVEVLAPARARSAAKQAGEE